MKLRISGVTRCRGIVTLSAIVNSPTTGRRPSGGGSPTRRSGCRRRGTATGRSCRRPAARRAAPRHPAGGQRPLRRRPVGQPVGDADLVGRRPVAHGRRRHQVAQAAEEGHRRHDDDARCDRPIVEVGERVDVRLDLGRHVEVGDAGSQRRLDHGGRRGGERPGAVHDGGGAGDGGVELGRRPDVAGRTSRPGCSAATACRRSADRAGEDGGPARGRAARPRRSDPCGPRRRRR